jgi:hypothetical protein
LGQFGSPVLIFVDYNYLLFPWVPYFIEVLYQNSCIRISPYFFHLKNVHYVGNKFLEVP